MLSNHPNVLGGAGDTSQSGAPVVGGPSSSTDNALVRWDGTTGQLIKNGIVTEANDSGTLTGPTFNATTSAVGSAFTNQPANDGVEILSSSALDITQTATVIGTTFGGNTVVVETVALNGTTLVSTVKTDWGLILAVKLSASCAGTITFREASADLTITTVTTGNTSKGVTVVAAANQLAYGRTVSAVSDGATTKQIGFQGTNTSDAVIYDSKPLNGATAVSSNSSFRTLTEIYTGDVEVARTETVTTNGAWTLTAGSLNLVATGTNQNITLTPSGTGSVTVSSTATDALLVVDTTQTTGYSYIRSGGTNKLYFGFDAAARYITGVGAIPLVFATNTTERMRISSAGNLLLGGLTTDGTGVLQLPTHSTNTGGIGFGNGVFTFTSAANRLDVTASSGLAVSGSVGAGGNFSTSVTYALPSGTGSIGFDGSNQILFGTPASGATWKTNGVSSLILSSTGAITLAAKIASYNGVSTAGWGVSTVQADGNIAGTSNARSAAVATYTVGAADGTFVVGGSINVTTSTAFSFSLDCSYTDDNNVARVFILPLAQLAGTFVASGLATNVTGAGTYESAAMTIRCKASTSITIRPSSGGTYTTVTYNVAANIRQVG